MQPLEFTPANDLEHLLCRAAREPGARIAFYRELLAAELCALTPEVPQNEERVTLQTEKKVALVVWEGPRGRYTPLFSSPARVDQIARHQGKAMGLMAMKGEQLFALLAQMKTPACLNPGFSFGKEFVPEEIAALADGSIFGGEQRVIQRETQVLLGQPARHPDELVVALRERLRRHAVADLAWVAQMHDPGSGESPHLLVALSCPGASPEAYRAVVEDVGAAIGGLAPDGGPVDLIRCDGGAAMGGYFAGIAPVYRRTPAI